MSRSERYLTAARLERLAAQLTAQDRQVIEAVAVVHLASGDQLRRTCFADDHASAPASRARQARRGLARLVDLGLLTRLTRRVGGVRAGSSGFVYALAPSGQRLIAGWRGDPPLRGRQPHEPGPQFADHRLAVSEIYTRLEAGSAGRSTLLRFDAEPDCWRSFAGPYGTAQRLKPDAFAAIQGAGEELLWFIEVDRGTVSSAALGRQVAAYLAYWRSGHRGDDVMPRVLWLVPDAKRAVILEAVIVAAQSPSGLCEIALTKDAIDRLIDAGSVAAHQTNGGDS